MGEEKSSHPFYKRPERPAVQLRRSGFPHPAAKRSPRMMLTEISPGSMFILGFLLLGLGALVKRALGEVRPDTARTGIYRRDGRMGGKKQPAAGDRSRPCAAPREQTRHARRGCLAGVSCDALVRPVLHCFVITKPGLSDGQ
jgi:hypothetical protein